MTAVKLRGRLATENVSINMYYYLTTIVASALALRVVFGAGMSGNDDLSLANLAFGIIELEQRAKYTPRLDSIEVSFGKIGSVSSPPFGRGFHLDVALSNPSPRAELYEQSVNYAVCSGLEPLGEFGRAGSPHREPEAYVARDILVPDAVPFGEKEHG